MIDVFNFNDYKALVAAQIEMNRDVRGYKTLLAAAASCQKSFFSHVHNSHVNLTPDHAAGLSTFWGFNELESEFFLALVDHARSGSDVLRNQIEARMKRLKIANDDISKRLQNETTKDQVVESVYYSSWYWSAIHVLTSVNDFRTPSAIANRLGIESNTVHQVLNQLEKMQLVRKTEKGFEITDKSIHLSKQSTMTEVNHSSWRIRAISNMLKKSDDSIHYSSVFTLSKFDAKRLHDMVLEFVLTTRAVISASPEEELYCLNADFFRV